MTDIDDMLRRFLRSRVAAGTSPRTVDWYRQQCTAFIRWLSTRNAPPWDTDTIEEYLVHERSRVAAGTVQARYRALSAWANWLVRRKLLAQSPLDDIERPHVPGQVMAYTQATEFVRLYHSIDGSGWIDYRDRCLLLVMMWSGLRVSEAVQLELQDVDLAAHVVLVRHAKGGEPRPVPAPSELGPQLLQYLMQRPPTPTPMLFLSKAQRQGQHGALTANGVRQMLERRCEQAGMRRLHPHLLRHGFAMELLNAGMQLSAVSKAMGHADVKITEKVYARWLTPGLVREYETARRRIDNA